MVAGEHVVVGPADVIEQFGPDIVAAVGGRARLVPADGGRLDGVAEGTILLAGVFEGVSIPTLLDLMPRLRWVHATGSGVDGFVSEDLFDRGVLVSNSAGTCAPALAEYAIAMMVALSRNFPRWQALQRDAGWESVFGPSVPVPLELRGRRVGIVGFGQVGAYLGALCKAFGMEVWATKRSPMSTAGQPIDLLLPPSRIDDLLENCDYVVLAASLNSGNRRLLGAPEFERMKPGAILVNIARGALIDDDALIFALESGRLRGAALDVFDPEPLPAAHPLRFAPGVIITPHVAGFTPEGLDRAIELFCANFAEFDAGRDSSMGSLIDGAKVR